MVYCTSDTLPLVEVRSGTKFTAPFGSAFTKCRRTSNGLKLQHTIKQACLSVGLFPFVEHRFLDVIPIGSRIIDGFIGENMEKSCIIMFFSVETYKTVNSGPSYRCFFVGNYWNDHVDATRICIYNYL